jgi:APA family basic amino acid/polyamine antiporter
LSLSVGAGSVVLLYVIANVGYMASLPVNGAPELAGPARVLADRAAQAERRGDTKEAEALLERRDKRIEEASTFDRGIAFARDQRVGTAVMELWSPTWGATLMALAIMISTFGCVNGMILMGARLYCVMARDGLFFSPVGRLNRNGVPAVGLVLQGLWSVLLVFSGSYDDLLDYVIFAVLIFYALTVAGLFVLRVKRPDAERPYRAFGYPIMPACYVLLCVVIGVDLLFVKPKFTWPGLIIVLAGIPVYFLWRLFGGRGATA